MEKCAQGNQSFHVAAGWKCDVMPRPFNREPVAPAACPAHDDHSLTDSGHAVCAIVVHPLVEVPDVFPMFIVSDFDKACRILAEILYPLKNHKAVASSPFEPTRQPCLPIFSLDNRPIGVEDAVTAFIQE